MDEVSLSEKMKQPQSLLTLAVPTGEHAQSWTEKEGLQGTGGDRPIQGSTTQDFGDTCFSPIRPCCYGGRLCN